MLLDSLFSKLSNFTEYTQGLSSKYTVYSIHYFNFWCLVIGPYKTVGELTSSNKWELISDGRVPMAYCMVMR